MKFGFIIKAYKTINGKATKVEYLKEFLCDCGRTHRITITDVISERGAIERLPEAMEKLGCKHPFVLCDTNTLRAAGERVAKILRKAEIYGAYYLPETLSPDERSVGDVIMHFSNCDCDYKLDSIIAVGSGVIGDICKILAKAADLPLITVATAPSMDGYASATSSMENHGVKVSLNSKCADIIIGDHDILAAAPLELRLSGLGDMIAKYISIAEWRISSLVNGEYYCDTVAKMIKKALAACIENADELVNGDPSAAGAVFDGLVLAGVATTYAGCSRPASGVEHYISHIWDMRALEFGTPTSTHGLQCEVGTVLAAKIYDMLRTFTPDREKAVAACNSFSYDDYKNQLLTLVGSGAETMIRHEERVEHKYDKKKTMERIDRIIDHWDEILSIIEEEIPTEAYLKALLERLESPVTVKDLGIPDGNIGDVFEATRDIRDKYVLSRLIFDLGITKEVKSLLKS